MQIADILEKTGQTETMVLREHAILTILTKLSRFESECALFEKIWFIFGVLSQPA